MRNEDRRHLPSLAEAKEINRLRAELIEASKWLWRAGMTMAARRAEIAAESSLKPDERD
jgi:hypothetical protein